MTRARFIKPKSLTQEQGSVCSCFSVYVLDPSYTSLCQNRAIVTNAILDLVTNAILDLVTNAILDLVTNAVLDLVTKYCTGSSY